MLKTSPAPAQPRNRLLALLPPFEYQRLMPRLHTVALPLRYVLYKARAPIDHVYFPTTGMASAMTVMADGSAIEVATIGNEGMTGLASFIGPVSSANEVMVQVEGEALRMSAEVLREEAAKEGALRRILVAYHTAYNTQVSYAVACNGLHRIEQRCCRWLLMTADRVESNVLPLTHEFLSIMLGVRRSSVSETLQLLQEQGLITSKRGEITIVDRPALESTACECYEAIQKEFARQFR